MRQVIIRVAVISLIISSSMLLSLSIWGLKVAFDIYRSPFDLLGDLAQWLFFPGLTLFACLSAMKKMHVSKSDAPKVYLLGVTISLILLSILFSAGIWMIVLFLSSYPVVAASYLLISVLSKKTTSGGI